MAEVQIKTIEALQKNRLEDLLDALLVAERDERFEPGTVEIIGPRDPDVADGGRDNHVEIRKEANIRVNDPLLPGAAVAAVYSCKTRNDPDNPSDSWKDKIREAIDPGKAWDKRKQGEEIAQKQAENRRKPSADGIYDHLARGGHYVIVLGWRPANVLELRKEIIDRLEWRIRVHSGNYLDLDGQVFIRDANYLKRAIERLDRRLPASLRKQLGLEQAPFWQDWAQWSRKFSEERRRMDFVEDAGRKLMLYRLRVFLEQDPPDGRAIHLWGRPGVGKTRLVHELLRRIPDADSRVHYSTDVARVVAWLETRPEMASDAIFVVDEVYPRNVRTSLITPFNLVSESHPNARLIVIGPLHKQYTGEPLPLEINPFNDAQARELIERETGVGDARIDRVVELCSGYPLFILWLGKSLSHNPALLAEPGASLTGSSPEWDACVGVLDSPHADEARALTRAKVLLLALLVPEGRWQRLPDAEQDRLARALAAEWGALMAEHDEAVARGLLRHLPDHSVYVSPQNLERMLLNHFFGGPNPPLDPEAIRARAPERFPRLLERAEQVGASSRCKHNLANAQLRAVASFASCEDRTGWISWMRALLPAARVEPEHAAEVVGAAIDRLGPHEVARDPQYLVRLRSTLAHLSHRALAPAAFSLVEASLFRLVDVPPESLDQDTFGLWAQLFAATAHRTRQPFSRRSELLRARLTSDRPRHRVLAIAALSRGLDGSIGSRGWVPGIDDVDGPWESEQLGSDETSERLQQHWSALLTVTDDPELDVARAARQAVIDNFRQGLRAGLSPADLDGLTDSVGAWTIEQRDELGGRIDEARRQDVDIVAQRGPALGHALTALSEALAPKTWDARLRAQLGNWQPGPWPVDSDERHIEERRADEQLARELVADPELFAGSAAWLVSERAVRARAFAATLGRCDRSQRLLSAIRMIAREPAGLEFATNYLLGWGARVGRYPLDDWMADAISREQPAWLVRVLLRLTPNGHRVSLLRDLIARPSLPTSALEGVFHRSSWPQLGPVTVLDELIELVAARSEQDLVREGVGLIAVRLDRTTNGLSSQTRAAIHDLLDRVTSSPLPAVVERHWSEAVVALTKSGDLAPLRAAFERSIRADTIDHPEHVIAALRRLAGTGIGDELWPLIAKLLESQPNPVRLAIALHRTGLLESLTPQLVLNWIGDDLARARIVATQLELEDDQLHPIARGLLARFGPTGPVADDLAQQTRGFGRIHASRADFLREQAKRARGWADVVDEALSEWATEVAWRLDREAALELDDEQQQLRYG